MFRGGPHDGESHRVSGIWAECGGHMWGDRPMTTCQYSWQEDPDGTIYGQFEQEYNSHTGEPV